MKCKCPHHITFVTSLELAFITINVSEILFWKRKFTRIHVHSPCSSITWRRWGCSSAIDVCGDACTTIVSATIKRGHWWHWWAFIRTSANIREGSTLVRGTHHVWVRSSFWFPVEHVKPSLGLKVSHTCHFQINSFRIGTEITDKSPVTWWHDWWWSTTRWVVIIATVIAVIVAIPHAGWRRQSWPPVVVSSAISHVGRCASHSSHSTTTPHWAKPSPTTTSTTLLPSRLLQICQRMSTMH